MRYKGYKGAYAVVVKTCKDMFSLSSKNSIKLIEYIRISTRRPIIDEDASLVKT